MSVITDTKNITEASIRAASGDISAQLFIYIMIFIAIAAIVVWVIFTRKDIRNKFSNLELLFKDSVEKLDVDLKNIFSKTEEKIARNKEIVNKEFVNVGKTCYAKYEQLTELKTKTATLGSQVNDIEKDFREHQAITKSELKQIDRQMDSMNNSISKVDDKVDSLETLIRDEVIKKMSQISTDLAVITEAHKKDKSN